MKYINFVNFTFGQDNYRKLDFARQNSSKAVLLKFPRIEDSHI